MIYLKLDLGGHYMFLVIGFSKDIQTFSYDLSAANSNMGSPE
jgi:hypothetical protein